MAIKRPARQVVEQDTQGGGKPARSSFADAFDAVKPGGGWPDGKYEAYVVNLELDGEIAPPGQPQGKLKAKITYEGAEDESEAVAGKEMSQQYSLSDDNGEMMAGCGFLKRDMETLGYKDFTLNDLEEMFGEIVQQRPRVKIGVRYKDGFTNAFLNGVVQG